MENLTNAIDEFSCTGGGCFPSPYNEAFLVPPYFMAIPLLAFPATLIIPPIGPLPVPSVFLAPSPIGVAEIPGPFMSMFRLYLSPTITGGVGIAMCFGPYTGLVPVPPPMVPIPYPPPLGNCIVKALPMGAIPMCGLIEDGINKIMEMANSVVSDINAGMAAISGNEGVPAEVLKKDQQGAGGLEVSLAVDLGEHSKFKPPAKGFSNIHISSFDPIGGVISSWVDRQLLEIVNKLLTLPTFTILLPDLKSIFVADWGQTEKLWDQFFNKTFDTDTVGGEAVSEFNRIDPDSFLDAGDVLVESLDAIEKQAIRTGNPLEDLYDVVNAIPLIELNEKAVDFKIPWLSPAQIRDFIQDLELWLAHMERELNRAIDVWGQWVCVGNFETADAWQDLTNLEMERLASEAGKTVDEWAQGCKFRQIADMIILSVEPVIQSVEENIEVLKSYLLFPHKLIQFKKELANYIRDIGCFLETYGQMFGGWFAKLQSQVVGYAEVITTIIAIIKSIKELFDIFVNFNDNCDICTNERYANFGWMMLLGLVIPDLPIIEFPKLPDVVLDLSDLDAQISIDLPLIHFSAEPIELPRLPFVRFPDLPSISFTAQLPPLPILPRLPDLPELPPLPPIPTLNLPTLPPPPKIPDVATSFEAILPLIEQILHAWCLLKKSLVPVPEGYLGDQIRALTNRPAYLIPLDILKPQLPNIVGVDLGFNEIRIETSVFLGSRISIVLQKLQEGADTWNQAVTSFADVINEAIKKFQKDMEEKAASVQSDFNEVEDRLKENARIAEDFVDENVGGALEDAENAIEGLTESAEAWIEEQTGFIQEGIDRLSQQVDQETVNAFESLNRTIRTRTREWAAVLQEEIDRFQEESGLNLLNQLGDYDKLTDLIQKEVFEKGSQAANEGLAMGIAYTTAGLNGMAEGIDKITQDVQDALAEAGESVNSALLDAAEAFNDAVDEADNFYEENIAPYLQGDQSRNPYQEQILGLVEQIKEIIEEANANPVDYRIAKENLNVPDARLPHQKTEVDKIEWMREELLAYGAELEAEADQLSSTPTLTALVNDSPSSIFGNQLASRLEDGIPSTQTITSAILPGASNHSFLTQSSPQLLAQELADSAETVADSLGGTGAPSGGCKGTCIVDLATEQMVEISSFENSQTAKTTFVPSSQPNKSHLAYNDNANLYLKKELTVPSLTDRNMASRVADEIFTLDNFLLGQPVMEAVNMLQAGITRDSASKFEWLDTTNPLRYGYGVELERTIDSFDMDKQGSPLPHLKIILLPQNQDGTTPEVLVDGNLIEYQTLITHRADPEIFGVSTPSVITGANRVIFPTIGNAQMTLDDSTAIYFDKYNQPSYTLGMENGFYHLRMAWFDRSGRLSTYGRSELVSPQPYSETAEPIDILLDQNFITPVFKSLDIAANQIFADLGARFEYMWDIDQDGLPDQVGDVLHLEP
ncbi:MAG: hypothetical protein V1760_03515, partial [Candidatus Peregrinibacteria bacterium]